MAKKYKPEYKKGDKVEIIVGPYTGEKGKIVRVRGFFVKTYDVKIGNVVLEKRLFRYLTMSKH